jgi:hypothetical protein
LSASVSELHLSEAEIALDGSHHSLDRNDMPDVAAIFEEGFGADLRREKMKKFQIPANYNTRRQSSAAAVKPMEIILEMTAEANNPNNNNNNRSERKLIPLSPQEMGFMDTCTNTEQHPDDAKPKKKPKQGQLGHPSLSLVTLDAADPSAQESDLSDSDHHSNQDDDDDDEEEEEEDESEFAEESREESAPQGPFDTEPNDYSIENLQQVSRYNMMDMYGDRGIYTGTLGADKEPSGFGTMKYDSGRFYKGEWKKGRWNGKGTLLNANGDSYQGDFVKDARHGRGVYRFTSGDVYEGDFFEDNRHGTGKFKFHNGSVYTGDFCMGSFEGHGRYDFDGGYYEGEWKRDEYYGKGRLQYKDGSNYQGRFKRGSAHGFGEESLADGTVRSGLWKRGEFLLECSEEECKRLEAKSAHGSERGERKGK